MPEPEFLDRTQTNSAQYKGPAFSNQYQNQNEIGGDIFEDISSLFRDMKATMKNFKVFYKKYLQPQENSH